jgi:secreted trypsin-like serine protease
MLKCTAFALFIVASLFCSLALGDSKIYYGHPAKEGEFPFMTRIHINTTSEDVHYCGGTLIGPWHVLTAAHCVSSPDITFAVQGGSISVNIYEGELIDVEQVHIHPEFNDLQNDIALLKLTKTFSPETNVRTIRLADKFKSAGTSFLTAGWGETERGVSADYLQWTRVQKIKPRDCRKNPFYRDYFDPALQMCVANSPHSACFGDGGGPLFFGSGSSAIQHGVVAGGIECGTMPTIYGKVKYYTDWFAGVSADSVCIETTNYYVNWKNMRAMCNQMGGTYEKLVEEGLFCCHDLNLYKVRDVKHSWSGCDSTSPITEFCQSVGRYTCKDDISYCSTL